MLNVASDYAFAKSKQVNSSKCGGVPLVPESYWLPPGQETTWFLGGRLRATTQSRVSGAAHTVDITLRVMHL